MADLKYPCLDYVEGEAAPSIAKHSSSSMEGITLFSPPPCSSSCMQISALEVAVPMKLKPQSTDFKHVEAGLDAHGEASAMPINLGANVCNSSIDMAALPPCNLGKCADGAAVRNAAIDPGQQAPLIFQFGSLPKEMMHAAHKAPSRSKPSSCSSLPPSQAHDSRKVATLTAPRSANAWKPPSMIPFPSMISCK